jgi:hypothetical protein
MPKPFEYILLCPIQVRNNGVRAAALFICSRIIPICDDTAVATCATDETVGTIAVRNHNHRRNLITFEITKTRKSGQGTNARAIARYISPIQQHSLQVRRVLECRQWSRDIVAIQKQVAQTRELAVGCRYAAQ